MVMTQYRQNLIPTVITDKNGKLTTVFRKAASQSKPLGILPVSPTPVMSPTDVESERATFIETMTYGSFDDVEADYDTIQEFDPTIIPLINHFTRSEGLGRIISNLSLVYEIIDLGDNDSRKVIAKLSRLKERITLAWHVGDMVEKLSLQPKTSMLTDMTLSYHTFAYNCHTNYHPNPSDTALLDDISYWNALAVFSFHSEQEPTSPEMHAFVDWARQQQDMEAIHALIEKCGTLDPRHLQDRLDMEQSTAASLRDGIL